MEYPRTFPFFRFAGSHREIGRQFGEACADLIHRHRDKAIDRLERRSRVPRDVALAKALDYRPHVLRHAPFFDDEIQGLADGAGLSLAEAYLLQLRAELAVKRIDDPDSGEPVDECTTFAVQAEAASNGKPLAGQNADLPTFYGEIAVVAEIVPDDMPSVLMLLPAGQVSYIGINDRGLSVFANYLTCDGWRLGLPRYMYSRLALTKESVPDAVAALRGVRRASSRNLIMADAHGNAVDMETTPTRDALLHPTSGILAHSNHYVAAELQDEERSPAKYVVNSRIRLERMTELLGEARGELDAERMQTILRDRACHPDTLSRAPEDDTSSDVMTFASVIAEPADRRLSVAVGPPHLHPYRSYEFSEAVVGTR